MPPCPFSDTRNLFKDLAEARKKDIAYNQQLGGHLITRYDDVMFVLEAHRTRIKVPTMITSIGWDNPDHGRFRITVSSFFVPRRMQRMEEHIRTMTHELVDGFAEQESVGIEGVFALPLPLMMIAKVVGLDP